MICLVAATPYETALLRRQLPFQPDPLLAGQTFSCRFAGENFLLLHCGIGPISAAYGLTRLLERSTPEVLLVFGCGGSYPASGLANGDLALATSEYFGDLGIADSSGFIPLSAAGLKHPDTGPPLFCQQVELIANWQTTAANLLQQAAGFAGVRVGQGPFVTVNTISGTRELCLQLEKRTGGICENMEGAALAQVAAGYQVPLLELRGISNPCGTRDRCDWDLPAGMEVAQRAILRLLKDFPHLRSLACN